MALSDERRAIADGITASRQGDGGAARRASGAANAASRRGESVVEDVNRIITPTRKARTLRTVDPVGAVPARTSPGTPQAYAPAQQGGGGIASPLTLLSISYADEPDYVETIDGSGLFRVYKISTITLEDADGQEVVVNVPAN